MKRRNFLKSSLAGLGWISTGYAFGNSSNLMFTEPGKFTCEALYYKVTPHGIKCNLCPHNCNVNEIRPGNCRTKTVKNGKLISSAFGNPYYVKQETPETENLYHFLPGEKILAIGTAGCNLSCDYCNVYNISQKNPEEISSSPLFPQQVIEMCLAKGYKGIAYTYTEPVAFFEYMLATAKLARNKGLKNIMVSNGYVNEAPLREIARYLDAAVISVKAFSDATYQKLTTGSIFPVFNTIKILKELNIWTELTHVLVPGKTDNFELLEKMFIWMKENNFENVPFHLMKMEPKYRMSQAEVTPDALLKLASDVAASVKLPFVYSENQRNTICSNCKGVIVERKDFKIQILRVKGGNCNFCGSKIAGVWH